MPANASRLTCWLVLGFAMVAGGLVVAAVGVAWTLQGFFSVAGEIPVDGGEHSLAVDQDRDHLVWAYDATTGPTCELVDGASGDVLALSPVERDLRRSDGSAGDWVAIWEFDPKSGSVLARCDRIRGAGSLQVTPALSVDGLLGSLLVRAGLPLLLVVAGSLVLAVSAIRWVRAQSRPETT